MKLFAENLKTAIEKTQYSQTDIARFLGTTQQAVSRWVNGQTEPSYFNMLCLCSLLHTTPNDLFGYDDTLTECAIQMELDSRMKDNEMKFIKAEKELGNVFTPILQDTVSEEIEDIRKSLIE